MSPLWTPTSYPQVWDTSQTLSTIDTGITVTSDAVTAHTKGPWVTLVDPTTNDTYELIVEIRGVALSSTDTAMLLDIGLADTGGGNETVVVPDINCGFANRVAYRFPVYVKAGIAVRCRNQSKVIGDTADVRVWLFQSANYFPMVGRITPHGLNSGASKGVNITASADAYSAWVEIDASTEHDAYCWQCGIGGGADSGSSNRDVWVQLGVGADINNVAIIGGPWHHQTKSTEQIISPARPCFYNQVPSGSKIFGRAAMSGTGPGLDVIAYGME